MRYFPAGPLFPGSDVGPSPFALGSTTSTLGSPPSELGHPSTETKSQAPICPGLTDPGLTCAALPGRVFFALIGGYGNRSLVAVGAEIPGASLRPTRVAAERPSPSAMALEETTSAFAPFRVGPSQHLSTTQDWNTSKVVPFDANDGGVCRPAFGF